MWSLNAVIGLPHYSANEKFSVMIIISALAGGATGTLAEQSRSVAQAMAVFKLDQVAANDRPRLRQA